MISAGEITGSEISSSDFEQGEKLILNKVTPKKSKFSKYKDSNSSNNKMLHNNYYISFLK